jgi:hypothetical protein
MKRYRRRAARTVRMTPAAVAAFRAGDRAALHDELGLKSWQPSPLDVGGRCPWPAGTAGAKAWPEMVAVRAQLENQLGDSDGK